MVRYKVVLAESKKKKKQKKTKGVKVYMKLFY